MKRHRRDLEVISDMNLTNLMDTAFILLIAFMLVAPALKHGIDIDLPPVSDLPVSTGGDPMTIVIAKSPAAGMDDEIYVDDKRLTIEDLRSEIQLRQDTTENLVIVIEADKNAKFGMFAKVTALLKRMGIEGIGIATDPEES